jgi:GNAT superfamily N-acetyltransferase
MIEYAVEDWLEALPELRMLFNEHWEEIALDQDSIKLEPDYTTYANLAVSDALHLVTARADGLIVGYHLSIIKPHLHYKSSLTCFTDVFFLKKDYRKGVIGYKLIKFFRDSVKEKGVQKVYMGTKLHLDLGPLLERLGFTPIERIYSQVFHD